MIGAGDLNERIILNEPVSQQNDAGETVTTDISQWSVWANVRAETGREVLRNNRIDSDLTYIIRIRWHDCLNEKWTITCRDRDLQISKVIPVGDRQNEMEILAHEVR